MTTEEIIPELLKLEITETEGQVIVHCSYTNTSQSISGLRIWNSTVLADNGSNHESNLVHVDGLFPFPDWTAVFIGQTIRFTLVFSRLPASCQQFHLIERIPEPGGLVVPDIIRNQTDVYYIKL